MSRIILSGHNSSICAVLDRLTTQSGATVVRVPTIGDCLASGMKPQLWHSAMAGLMACHPGLIVFVGGIRPDHEWLLNEGATLVHVSDRLNFEVATGFSSDARRWKCESVASLDAKLSSVLEFLKTRSFLAGSAPKRSAA